MKFIHCVRNKSAVSLDVSVGHDGRRRRSYMAIESYLAAKKCIADALFLSYS